MALLLLLVICILNPWLPTVCIWIKPWITKLARVKPWVTQFDYVHGFYVSLGYIYIYIYNPRVPTACNLEQKSRL